MVMLVVTNRLAASRSHAFLFILVAGILLCRCSSVGNSLANPGSPFYLDTLPSSPTPGMALIVNLNAGADSNVRRDVEIVGVFQGWFSETDLVNVVSGIALM